VKHLYSALRNASSNATDIFRLSSVYKLGCQTFVVLILILYRRSNH